MGRKPTKSLNLPPRMRARTRWRTTNYHYQLGGKPRREEPPGLDFVLAIKRRAEIEGTKAPRESQATFRDAADIYVREILPAKAPRTQTGDLRRATRSAQPPLQKADA